MNSLINFLVRFHFFFLFIILEIIAISFVIRDSEEKKSVVLTSANSVTASIHTWVSSTTDYFSLTEENERLQKQLTKLQNEDIIHFRIDSAKFRTIIDSFPVFKQYDFIAGKAINNSVYNKKNFITINKGTLSGIENEMAISSEEGAIGYVIACSENYSLGISLLNTDIGISAKLKKNDYFGSVIWDGVDYRYAKFNGIPNHIILQQGDSVITSGFSAIFPEGILVGFVDTFEENAADNFYDVRIKLAVDFKNIKSVFLIKNKLKEEQTELEKLIEENQ